MKSFLKLVAAWVAVGAAFAVGGLVDRALHLRMNLPVDHSAAYVRLVAFGVGAAVLVLGMWPLARGLAASGRARSGVLAVFLFLALGANTIFDGAIYTAAFDGALASSLLMYLMLAVMLRQGLRSTGCSRWHGARCLLSLRGRLSIFSLALVLRRL